MQYISSLSRIGLLKFFLFLNPLYSEILLGVPKNQLLPPRPRSGLRDQDEETTAVAARNAWTPNSREKAGSPSLPPPFDRSPPTIPISISDMNR